MATDLHRLIANGGRVLVVGPRNKDWPEWQAHPALVFWPSDDIERAMRAGFPDNIKAVVFLTRFIPHSAFNMAAAEARKRRAVIFAPTGTNEARQILVGILGKQQEEPQVIETQTTEGPVMTVAPEFKAPKPPRGAVKQFVQRHVRREGTHKAEGARLFALMGEAGIATTPHSLEQTVRMVRIALGWATPRAGARGWQGHKGVVPVVTEVITRPQSAAQAVGGVIKDDSGLLKLIDDVALSLALVREEVAKVLSNKSHEAEALRAKLRAMLE